MKRVDISKLITPKDLSEDMKCHRSRIYQMIKEGKLKETRISGVVFVNKPTQVKPAR
jgi:hypothetical protein